MKYLIIALFCTLGQNCYTQTSETYYNNGLLLIKDPTKVTKTTLNQAVENFSKALQLNPDYTDARFQLAYSYSALSKDNEALENARMVRKSWGNVYKIHSLLGYIFRTLKQYDSSIASYKKCIELAPNVSEVYNDMANTMFEKNDFQSAVFYFTRYAQLEKNIDDYVFWFKKGAAENRTNLYNEAKGSLLKSLKLDANVLDTYNELGFSYKGLKNIDSALWYFNKSIALEPNNFVAYAGKGDTYREISGDCEMAQSNYLKALAQKPNQTTALLGMGVCSNTNGNYKEAIDYFKKAIKENPEYAAAYSQMGFSLFKLNKYDEAIAALNKALKLYPQAQYAMSYLTQIYIAKKNKPLAQKYVDELKKIKSEFADDLQKKVSAMK
ncbi:MAG: tetratricopeptide repeat protein [Bacteroidetes bacterium]|nr:tetratricopeptide repeat protein [Bacteroidota bacterium]